MPGALVDPTEWFAEADATEMELEEEPDDQDVEEPTHVVADGRRRVPSGETHPASSSRPAAPGSAGERPAPPSVFAHAREDGAVEVPYGASPPSPAAPPPAVRPPQPADAAEEITAVRRPMPAAKAAPPRTLLGVPTPALPEALPVPVIAAVPEPVAFAPTLVAKPLAAPEPPPAAKVDPVMLAAPILPPGRSAPLPPARPIVAPTAPPPAAPTPTLPAALSPPSQASPVPSAAPTAMIAPTGARSRFGVRAMMVVGGAGLLIIGVLAIVLASGGGNRGEAPRPIPGKSTPTRTADTPHAPATALAQPPTQIAPEAASAAPGAALPAPTPGAPTAPAAPATPSAPELALPAAPPPATGAASSSPRPTPGNRVATTGPSPGKRPKTPVVVDYDKTPPPPTPGTPATEESLALQKARAAYARGNQRLFVGDSDAAIRAYREALAAYPGYAAGHRGLGLAYSQKGDTARAIDAFETYLRIVPRARDVSIIQKRVETLRP
jgi:tetratricopeptide repeat protein